MLDHLSLFRSLFKSRSDVFAIRWEKDNRSGYWPVYDINWSEFALHKAKGGSLEDFASKELVPLTDERLKNHLNGFEVIGVYPLLQDNTSWFIAADFDQHEKSNKTWHKECQKFIAECEKYELPVYLERSRSGLGGHVWMFFEDPFPAAMSRKLFISLLKNSGVISNLEIHSSFDRLFPNQDFHSGKGFGNLIALPLQKVAFENGNSCFIDPLTLHAYPDQWTFIKGIKKVSSNRLYELLQNISPSSETYFSIPRGNSDGKIHITLSNQITVLRHNLTSRTLDYLRQNLNFLNAEFLIKKKVGKSTYNTETYFRTLGETNDHISIPRGFIGTLIQYCKDQHTPYLFEDKRERMEPVDYKSAISLYEYQQAALEITEMKDFGVIVAPPGSGKTVMGLQMIAQKRQPALIIVHRKQLFDQWVERIQSFLGIPKFRIGKIEGGRCEIGNEITVAMIQSLQNDNLSDKIYHSFGLIIIDECHHIPAKTFREIIVNFHSYYLYGFTATPFRKNGDENLIFIHIGKIIHKVILPHTKEDDGGKLAIIIRDSSFSAPFNPKTDNFETLLNILIHDTNRNDLIVADIRREVTAGRKVLVLTERKAHVSILHQYLKNSTEIIAITGDDAAAPRKSKMQQIQDGNYQVLITTGQFMGEGTDIEALDCLILAFPFAFEGKLIQYIGRVQRSITKPLIYDYRDYKMEYLQNLFSKRNIYYRKLVKTGHIRQFEELVIRFDSMRFSIGSADASFTINCLELPIAVEKFLPEICWKIRIVKYNNETGEMTAEIVDYQYDNTKIPISLNDSFYFQGIEKIKFRAIDTAGFLKSVILKKEAVTQRGAIVIAGTNEKQTNEIVVIKTMKVPFYRIRFLYGSVSFPLFIEEINQELIFQIDNSNIRPEFDSIRDYFCKALKKRLIAADIAIRLADNVVLSAIAKSEDINSINNFMIENIRFEFIKRKIFKPKEEPFIDPIHTLDSLLGQFDSSTKVLFNSEQALFENILNVRKSKHYLQLKYLSSEHESSVLKLRFVLQPFSFLFLLSGEKQYHMVWETLDTEEATYIWHTERTREALKITLQLIESIITSIKKDGRQDYLKQDNADFSRILHDYSDFKKGFIVWKGVLDERII